MNNTKRWSKLQKRYYDITDSNLNIQLHCVRYRMKSWRGSTDLPRYWITLGKEIIFDYPKDFQFTDDYCKETHIWHIDLKTGCHYVSFQNQRENGREDFLLYPWVTDVHEISQLIEDYLNTPKEDLVTKQFDNDYWHLTDILKASDKRIGKRRLTELKEYVTNPQAIKIIEKRLSVEKYPTL